MATCTKTGPETNNTILNSTPVHPELTHINNNERRRQTSCRGGERTFLPPFRTSQQIIRRPLTPRPAGSRPTSPPWGPTSTWHPSPSDSSTPSRRHPTRSTASTISRPHSPQTHPASRPHLPHGDHPRLHHSNSPCPIRSSPNHSGATALVHPGVKWHPPPLNARCCWAGRGTSWHQE